MSAFRLAENIVGTGFARTIQAPCAKLNFFLLRLAASSATKAKKPMTPELQRALTRHTQWFGSYKASGELTKIQVWLLVNGGQIEFLTPGNSYKVKRARRNPRVICYVGSNDGPAISGTAEIITDRSELARVYRGYWRAHPLRMALVVGLRLWIEMLLNKRVVVRVQPDEPNPLAGLTDPAI
jgi:hypothetical protein